MGTVLVRDLILEGQDTPSVEFVFTDELEADRVAGVEKRSRTSGAELAG